MDELGRDNVARGSAAQRAQEKWGPSVIDEAPFEKNLKTVLRYFKEMPAEVRTAPTFGSLVANFVKILTPLNTAKLKQEIAATDLRSNKVDPEQLVRLLAIANILHSRDRALSPGLTDKSIVRKPTEH